MIDPRSFFCRLTKAKRYALGSALLLIAAIVFRHALTSSMVLHMIVHIPGILVAGVLAGYALSARFGAPEKGMSGWVWRQYQKYNGYGVPGLLLVTLLGAYWMVPKALDQVLASAPADGLKFVVLFGVGIIVADSLKRSNNVIKLFFVGNFCWMMAVVGMLYQQDTSRLCNFYLLNDQQYAGIGLVILSVVLPVLWLLVEIKSVRRFLLH
ncbi:MAG: hypothetical protein ABI228_01705 [Burkholderiaceae bacterium]